MLEPSLWRAFGATLLVALAAGGASAATARAAVELANPLRVVVLGDSYSTGNGAGDYYGPRGCYRSSTNWAKRYTDMLRKVRNITLVNRACSDGVLADSPSAVRWVRIE